MSEKISQDINDYTNRQPMGLTPMELFGLYDQKRDESQQAARRIEAMREKQYDNLPQSSSRTPAPSQSTDEREKTSLKSRRTRVIGITAASVALAAGLTAGAYHFDIGGAQHGINSVLGVKNDDQIPTNGINMSPTFQSTEKSLSSEQCVLPKAMFLVATVSAEMPLVPIVQATSAETGKSVLTKINPYLSTRGGYKEFKVKDLPLAGEVCDTSGGIVKTGDHLTIHRSLLKISFVDPVGLFGTSIYPQPEGTKLDPTKGQYALYPTDMRIDTDKDPILNQSKADLTKSLQDPEQLRLLLGLVENGAVKELDNVVNVSSNVSYEDKKDKDLQHVFDKLIAERLGWDVKDNSTITLDGNYDFQTAIRDPKTKQPITSETATNLKYLDATQPIHITSIDVKYGGVTTPNVKSTPTPTPSPMPTVTPNP